MRKLFLIILVFSMSLATFAQEDALEIEWNTRANELEGVTGTSFQVSCPEDGEVGSLWGTEIYTDDSSICTAAVHMGLIDLEDGGEFFIIILDGEEEYESTDQNDIESSEWGSWSRSFAVSDEEIEVEALEIEWTTAARDLGAEIDDMILVACPEDGEAWGLFGTEIYTDDSSICTAAVHMGLIDFEDGGEVVVTLLEGEDEYESTEQNDIESSSWGSWETSFSVSLEADVIEIEWDTRGYDLEGEVDDEFVVLCPEDGEASSLWGTEIYTDDSSICTAAVHMGLIDFEDGGEVLVIFFEGEDEHEGTEQNDIESSDWGSWDISFSVFGEK